MDRPTVVPVGTVGRAHGVRGWVRVRSDMEPADELLRYDTWLVERSGAWRPTAVRTAHPHGNVLIAHLDGVDDRDAAAGLTGSRLGLPRESLPPLADGQYYWVDLIGLEVMDERGKSLGTVREMMETGANDVMLVRPHEPADSYRIGVSDRIVPFLVGDVVREVDLDAGRIHVSWSVEDDR